MLTRSVTHTLKLCSSQSHWYISLSVSFLVQSTEQLPLLWVAPVFPDTSYVRLHLLRGHAQLWVRHHWICDFTASFCGNSRSQQHSSCCRWRWLRYSRRLCLRSRRNSNSRWRRRRTELLQPQLSCPTCYRESKSWKWSTSMIRDSLPPKGSNTVTSFFPRCSGSVIITRGLRGWVYLAAPSTTTTCFTARNRN